MASTSILYNLQKIDTQIDKTIRRLSEIDILIQEDEQLKGAILHHTNSRKLDYQAQMTLKNIEQSVSEAQIKIQTNESALYGGKIRSPKELQDLQAEIESLKRHLNVLEDDNLAKLIHLEETKASLSQAEDNLDTIQTLTSSKIAGLLGEQDKLIRLKNTLFTERDGIFSSIPSEIITQYEKLRESKKGIAVSAVDDNSCSVCGCDLRPAELQTARGGHQLVFCSSCGRILYVG
jgi:predicted  nucleic acid-binding Zn-ribbon protein